MIMTSKVLRRWLLFPDKIKNMGLKYYMWYSLPFKGGNPLISQKFEGKYIRYKAPRQLYVP